MQSEIELLFKYLDVGNFDAFQLVLKKHLVNTVWSDVLYNYDYTGYSNSVQKKEVQNNLLIFRAMWRKAYRAFALLLDYGVDLLSQETFETYNYVAYGYNAKPTISKTNIAIICISNSEDNKFIQMTFDHICVNGLYENRIFIDFMIRHLKEVNRDKFNSTYLKIDVGSPLPYCFSTIEEYRAFLIESGVDISGIFFTKQDYLNFILDPSKEFDEHFLYHAFAVCNFTLDELKQIYETVKSDNIKRAVESFNPEVNPEFILELDAVCQEQDEKSPPNKRAHNDHEILTPAPAMPAPSLAPPSNPSPNVIKITAVHEQQYRHLTRRLALLEDQERKLRSDLAREIESKKTQKNNRAAKEKKPKKVNYKKAIDETVKSLKYCRDELSFNPVYQKKMSEKVDDEPEDNDFGYNK